MWLRWRGSAASCKRQPRPLVKEGARHEQTRNFVTGTRKENHVLDARWCLTPRQTGRLTICCKDNFEHLKHVKTLERTKYDHELTRDLKLGVCWRGSGIIYSIEVSCVPVASSTDMRSKAEYNQLLGAAIKQPVKNRLRICECCNDLRSV
jgi:hypothetical protein